MSTPSGKEKKKKSLRFSAIITGASRGGSQELAPSGYVLLKGTGSLLNQQQGQAADWLQTSAAFRKNRRSLVMGEK